MKIELTAPMQKVMTPQLMQRIERTLDEFPELQPHTLRIGLVMHSNVHGTADSRNMVIRLNTRARSGTSYFTIAHELTHTCCKSLASEPFHTAKSNATFMRSRAVPCSAMTCRRTCPVCPATNETGLATPPPFG